MVILRYLCLILRANLAPTKTANMLPAYRPRRIDFLEVLSVGDWKIKVYTIAKTGNFQYPDFYAEVKAKLPEWLRRENSFEASHEGIGFLLLHAGTEGLFSLVNWWVDHYMLNTHIFLTDPAAPARFTELSGDGLAPCVWELAVIDHERRAWTKHILQQYPTPDYAAYLAATFSEVL